MMKPSIKQKSNESVMKMMDYIKDKPESWFELISISIFHQNFQIMKYMIETFDITPQQIPLLNAVSMTTDISNDTSKQKPTENKGSFLEVECPLLIQSAIGGDIEIFKYLMDNGFGDNLNATGHITLSKKYKNSVITNCIGASAYYGNHKLLHYILENYQRKVDINFRTIEKKCKAKQGSITKEYTEATPMHLAIESDISQENSINCMKILDLYKASLIENDSKGNSLLHVAAKNNKLTIVKYIIEEFHMENLSKETNKEGQTPMNIGQNNKCEAICDYLRNNTEQADENIEEDLMELIKTQPKKKKGKKSKKKADKEFGLLNSTEYQETLKADKEEQSKPKQQAIIEKEEKKQIVPVTTQEEEAEYEELEKDEIKRDDYLPQQQQQQVYQNKQQNTSSYYQKQQNNYNNRKNYQQKGYNNKDYDYNYDYDYYSKGNRKYYDTNHNKNYYKYNNSNVNQSSEYQQKDKSNKKSYYLQEVTINPDTEKQIEPIPFNSTTELIPPSNEPYIEPNEDNSKTISQKEQLEEENEENDEEEDFLGEEPKTNTNAYQQQQQQQHQQQQKQELQPNIEDKMDYTQLADNYYQLEMKYETIQKEKRELESFIQCQYSSNRNNTSNIPSTEENINDLLELANEELDQKSKEIALLQKQVEALNLANIKNYNLSKLNQLKENYLSNLRQIEDAIRVIENK